MIFKSFRLFRREWLDVSTLLLFPFLLVLLSFILIGIHPIKNPSVKLGVRKGKMTTSNRPTQVIFEQQQPVYGSSEKTRIFAVMNDVPLTTESAIPQDQQLFYYNIPMNYHPTANPQEYVHQHQSHSNPNVNQQPGCMRRISTHHIQLTYCTHKSE